MADYPDEEHIVKILSTEFVTHNVKRFKLTRPDHYIFKPGQATDIMINDKDPEWNTKRGPFTFTGLNDWDHLEFTIKIYDDHKGLTHKLGTLKPGAELILHDIWGAIHYKGEGCFIAGGAGITPFIAIFRQLYKDNAIGQNQLFFSNKTVEDIILKDEMEKILGKSFHNTLTQQKTDRYENRKIDKAYLKEKITNLSQFFYICGPDAMVSGVANTLRELGVENSKIVVEDL